MDSTTASELPATSLPEHLKQELIDIVGTAHVLVEDADRSFYSEDVFRALDTAAGAVCPGTVEELSAAVGAITKAGFAAVPRGGGMSYTDGYLHASTQSITIDMRRLNRVVEINEQDMYVTVECGATWSELNDALKAKGLRTPYWGPLSGLMATVGGALSQNSVFFGSGLYGTAVEQVLGMDVVLADGTLAPLGGHAIKDGVPFMKHYGPDLMGLFLADAGAHGFKARATLKLIKRPKHRKHMAAGFQSYEKLAAAISDLSRDGIAAEVMGFDAGQQSTRVTENKKGLSEDLKTLRKVIETGGILDGIKVATAGRDYLKDVPYGLHFAIEDHFKGGLKDRISAAKDIIARHGGKTLPGSVTTIVHADPIRAAGFHSWTKGGSAGCQCTAWCRIPAHLRPSRRSTRFMRNMRLRKRNTPFVPASCWYLWPSRVSLSSRCSSGPTRAWPCTTKSCGKSI